jgi:hypothetical protein
MQPPSLDTIISWALAIGVGTALAFVAFLFVLSLFGVSLKDDKEDF